MTCLLTRVEEFTPTVYRMAMAVRKIALPCPPCAKSVPMELRQQTQQGLIGTELARRESLSLDRVLLIRLI